MLPLIDIVTYGVIDGSVFAAVCALTRGGRGWPWRLAGLALLAAYNVPLALMELMKVDFARWLSVYFVLGLSVVIAVIFLLSRDSLGRRLFLSVGYGAYAACYLPVFHVVAYRNVFGLSADAALVAGLVVVAAANAVYVFWVLPQMPSDIRGFDWKGPCFAAGVLAVSLYVSGIWPVSVVSAAPRFCAPFVLASVVVWVVFPLLCRQMRDRLRAAAAERSLELMMAEVRERRAAVEEARRLRHDQRHHRAQIAEYMLFGRHDKVLAYLNALDEEAKATADRFVWCENETVNAILSGCARRARSRGVVFAAEARVGRTVALPDVDLVVVFANLIENAVNACAVGAKVAVNVLERSQGIGITVSNPVSPSFALSEKGLPCEAPGVGLQSVRDVVERRRGEWSYSQESGVLTCQAVLIFG